MILSKFDCVILANVPADELSDVQQSVIRSNTHEQGAGLIMIGGPQSFGAGGWQDTELEKALPVTVRKQVDQGRRPRRPGAHHARLGNARRQRLAEKDRQAGHRKALARRHARHDLLWRHGHIWHIPFQNVGDDAAGSSALSIPWMPGDMPDLEAVAAHGPRRAEQASNTTSAPSTSSSSATATRRFPTTPFCRRSAGTASP